MTNGEFFMVVGTVVVLTVGIFWSHFEAEAEQIRRKHQKKK